MHEAWHDFFIAEAGASAALLGLLFVSVSLNLQKILKHVALTNTAALDAVMLLAILIVSSMMLVPDLSNRSYGIAILCAGLPLASAIFIVNLQNIRAAKPELRSRYVFSLVRLEIATAPYLVAGATLLAGLPFGLYWLAVAMMASLLAALIDAWILLVEINR